MTASGNVILPTFLGLGAPRCGTTWLFRCLREHPDVFLPLRKELQFFDYDRIEGRIQEYWENFGGAGDRIAIGEISTRYLSSDRAPARVREHLPRVRLFASLRNPADQVYSHYWHLRRQNFHQWERDRRPDSFQEALERFPEKLLSPARYATHLCRWLEYFPRERLHLVFYEDIQKRPEKVIRSLYAHLGVEADFQPSAVTQHDARSRRGVSPQSQRLDRLHSIVHDVANRRAYQPVKSLIGVRRAEQLKERFRVREILERVFFKSGYPSLPSQQRNYLHNHFRDEVLRLETLSGRDLSTWR